MIININPIMVANYWF